jgi:hypothetical protein
VPWNGGRCQVAGGGVAARSDDGLADGVGGLSTQSSHHLTAQRVCGAAPGFGLRWWRGLSARVMAPEPEPLGLRLRLGARRGKLAARTTISPSAENTPR